MPKRTTASSPGTIPLDSIQMILICQWRIPSAPWVILAAWLLIDLVYACYYRFNAWGPEGGIPQFIAFVTNAIALGGWTIVWLVLWVESLRVRIAYVLVGFGGLFAISYFGSQGRDIEMFLEFPKLIVGVATPLILLRRQGWQIASGYDASHPADAERRRRFHFLILDLLILITGVAAFMALLLADGTHHLAFDFAGTGALVFAVLATSILAMSLQRFWLAIVASITLIPIASFTAVWLADGWAGPYSIYCLRTSVCLLPAFGAIRWCGYRLGLGHLKKGEHGT
jgi:hypothetical protein